LKIVATNIVFILGDTLNEYSSESSL